MEEDKKAGAPRRVPPCEKMPSDHPAPTLPLTRVPPSPVSTGGLGVGHTLGSALFSREALIKGWHIDNTNFT